MLRRRRDSLTDSECACDKSLDDSKNEQPLVYILFNICTMQISLLTYYAKRPNRNSGAGSGLGNREDPVGLTLAYCMLFLFRRCHAGD